MVWLLVAYCICNPFTLSVYYPTMALLSVRPACSTVFLVRPSRLQSVKPAIQFFWSVRQACSTVLHVCSTVLHALRYSSSNLQYSPLRLRYSLFDLVEQSYWLYNDFFLNLSSRGTISILYFFKTLKTFLLFLM